jgi:guanylate kinase
LNNQELQQQYTDSKGILIVVSGPAGAGKGTICKCLVEGSCKTALSVSETTRPMRKGDAEGVTYHFVSKTDFENRISENYYLEWARVYDNYYGTPKSRIMEKLNAGHDVILEIDPQGADNIRKNFPQAITVFIMPPSLEELRRRITGRGSETPEQIDKRMSCTEDEIGQAPKYDYILVNRDQKLEQTVEQLKAVITAEHLRTSRILNTTPAERTESV